MMNNIYSIRTLFFVIILISILSCKVSMPYTLEMKTELKKMYKEDQHIQNLLITSIQEKKGVKKIDSIDRRIKEIFNENYKVVKDYFKNYGFPGIKQNNKFTSFAFWIIVQHCDHDVSFQKSVLKEMKRKIKTKDINFENYAYLYDRVKKAEGKKQLYGTQVFRDSSGNYKIYDTDDLKNLNKRRLSIGLETTEKYLESFK